MAFEETSMKPMVTIILLLVLVMYSTGGWGGSSALRCHLEMAAANMAPTYTEVGQVEC